MTFENLLSRLRAALERAEVPYMVTGSVASSAHGLPRSTRDLDIVIAPTRAQLVALITEFPSSDYYADEEQAVEALSHRSQFNVIDFATGWKVDFIIAEESEYGRAAMLRRHLIAISANPVYVASAEDVILAKLRWAKLGKSDRQLEDAAGIVRMQMSKLDFPYIEQWARKLDVQAEWSNVRERSQLSD